MSPIPLLIIVGPTAVGKTKLSIELAKQLNAEIISGDSMQVYKYLNIGTAKIKKEEMESIEHYLIDFLSPETQYTVADFQKNATQCIKHIHDKGKMSIIAGGTGLYIDSIVYENYDFQQREFDNDYRNYLWLTAKKEGNEILHKNLRNIDPRSALNIHVNDTKRIIRALEYHKETGSLFSDNIKEKKINKNYKPFILGLYRDRANLYERINERVNNMFNAGWINEVEKILKKGYKGTDPALQGLGYKQIIEFIYDEISLEECKRIIKRNTRRFAKRQLTWFRKSKEIHWLDMDNFILNEENLIELAKKIQIKVN